MERSLQPREVPWTKALQPAPNSCIHDEDDPPENIDGKFHDSAQRPASNPDLSFRARGLLVMMLSLPEDWQTHQIWLESQGREGTEAIRTTVRELEEAGYLKRTRIKQKGRLAGMKWHWFDCPQIPPAGKPTCGDMEPTKYPQQQRSKESRSRSEIPDKKIQALWKPSYLRGLTKQEQLSFLPNVPDFPTEVEVNGYILDQNLMNIIHHREDVYRDLCVQKWRHWMPRAGKWVLIRNWKADISGLDRTIGRNLK